LSFCAGDFLKSTNERYYSSLTRVIKVFDTAGIEVNLLKRAYLTWFIYKDIGLRPMIDIDIDEERRSPEVERLLIEMGYKYQVITNRCPLV